MPPETELIKQQMGQTRAALSEKIEGLENKVFGIVTTATDTVSQTVQEVGATVRETTQGVHATVNDAMSSLHGALDVSRHMHRHPWLMVGGSMLAGYVGGVMLDNLEQGRLPSLPAMPAQPEQLLPRDSEVRQRLESEPAAQRTVPSFLRALADSFAPELEKLKVAAVGMAMSAVRDRVGEMVPPQMREDFTQMMDRFTTKLGGEPHPPGAMLGAGEESDDTNGARTARSMNRG